MKTYALAFCLVLVVQPTETSFNTGETVTVTQPVYDDLYIAGGKVIINAPVHGDLIVAGGDVSVNDTVTYDLVVTGGIVQINGYVGDDVRCAGGTIDLMNNVGDDVVAAGGEITLHRKAQVGGDMLAMGGTVMIDGVVKGSANIQSGKFEFNGRIGSNLACRSGEANIQGTVLGSSELAAQKMVIGRGAAFHQDVRYWTPQDAVAFGSSMKSGNAQFDSTLKIKSGHWAFLGFASFAVLVWYLGTALLSIAAIQYLFGTTMRQAAGRVLTNSIKSIGAGALFFVGVPIAIIISFITLVGVPLGLILLFAYIMLILLATIITALVAAHWINNVYYASSWNTPRLIGTGFLIFIFLKLASLTPFVGPLLMLVMAFMAFGSILLTIRWNRKEISVAG